MAGRPAYTLLRGVSARDDSSAAHDGADLGNGEGAGIVRSAAAGLVVRGAGDDWQTGYGYYVTIAHRLQDGGLVYTVYAHLAEGSVRVRAGEPVWAGRMIGRVGRTGRATTDHLHFELRRSTDPQLRWEKTEVADPLEFVSARLPAHRARGNDADGVMEWAELSGLIGPDAESGGRLNREAWWRMLARIERIEDAALGGGELRDSLIAHRMLSPHAPAFISRSVSWGELAADLRRAWERRLRAAICPQSRPLRRACGASLGTTRPSLHPELVAARSGASPTLAAACLVCADLCSVPLLDGAGRPWHGARRSRR